MDISTYDDVPFTHEPYRAAADRYRLRLSKGGKIGAPIAAHFAGLVAQLRRRPAAGHAARDPAHAFDLGITHFDLANNYGPPYGAAEENFGRILREDFAALPR